ncbi:N-alpha-acetyltransferase 35, NatC auxiliary subunit [Hetaerina americana]|uniref:N-alpha-acetyltransferase 35, NatC auxiliary subunit n=1 Tax=Hetaerina americana TaxID=62018 RepID=UPI003A7F33F1
MADNAGDTDDEQKESYNMGCDDVSNHWMPDVDYNWVEVTNDFFECIKDLELGELLHDEMFGLFEAMSAIEMMDPKMDAGMLCNRGNKKALSFDQAVQAGTLKLDDLTAPEQIGIIDSTLACVVSWLEGHSLAQTVFTNLYLHKPYQIEDKPIKAFSICILKIVEIFKDFVNRAMVFEEEDFQPMAYGYRLVPDISEARALGMLREVEEDLHRRLKGTRARMAESRDALTQREHEDLLALYSRIKFTRMLYQALLALGQKREQSSLSDCQRFLAGCTEVLLILQKTTYRGIKPELPPGGGGKNDHPTIMGFDPLVNQRLLPPTFPRYTKIKSRDEALEYFEELLNRLKTVCKITSYNSFHSALDFFIEFSRQSPCILSRSILQLLYLPTCSKVLGTHNFVDVLRDAAKNFISPPALMPKSTLLNIPQAKEYVDTFLNHCVRPFGSLIQICGHNRARQRDKLAHLLEEFGNLQDEAERMDAYLHSLSLNSDTPRPHLACFGTWILYHTLRIMIMYLLSGFELELYSVHEYHYIFWYLSEFLYGWLISALTRADAFLLEQEVMVESQKSRGSKKNKIKKKKNRPYGREITLNQAIQNMCGGYYRAMAGFQLDGKISMPHPEFDSEKVRYEHRFGPFGSLLTPPPVQYSEFKEMTCLTPCKQTSSASLYLTGCEQFHQARSLLEMISNPDQEVNSLLKIAKTNFVVLKLLAGGHKKDSTVPPDFDFSVHYHFPIIKLV